MDYLQSLSQLSNSGIIISDHEFAALGIVKVL